MRGVAFVATAVLLAGCGGQGPARPVSAVTEREWRSNTAIIVRQLQGDIAATQIAGATTASGRAALRDESSLYGLLIAYSDFAGCREMVASAGELPPAFVRVDRQLIAGCRHLERAAKLFTRAVTRNDGTSLVAASRESGRALPPLVRAASALGSRR